MFSLQDTGRGASFRSRLGPAGAYCARLILLAGLCLPLLPEQARAPVTSGMAQPAMEPLSRDANSRLLTAALADTRYRLN